MRVVQMGDIAESVCSEVRLALPYVEDDILSAVVRKVLPEHGIIIEATKRELRDNRELGGVLYNEVTLTTTKRKKTNETKMQEVRSCRNGKQEVLP